VLLIADVATDVNTVPSWCDGKLASGPQLETRYREPEATGEELFVDKWGMHVLDVLEVDILA